MGLMDKAKDALNTDQGRDAVSKGLDKAEDVAKDKGEQIDQARQKIDEQLNQGGEGDDK